MDKTIATLELLDAIEDLTNNRYRHPDSDAEALHMIYNLIQKWRAIK